MGDAAADAVWTLAKSKTGFFDDGSFKRPATKAKVAKSATTHAGVAKRLASHRTKASRPTHAWGRRSARVAAATAF